MSTHRTLVALLMTSIGLGACATNIKVPEIPIFDSPAMAAHDESALPWPSSVVACRSNRTRSVSRPASIIRPTRGDMVAEVR